MLHDASKMLEEWLAIPAEGGGTTVAGYQLEGDWLADVGSGDPRGFQWDLSRGIWQTSPSC